MPAGKRRIAGGVAALLVAAAPIITAPQASAGCIYGGQFLGKCDGPIQPDGNWERCITVARYVPSGLSSHLIPVKNCQFMGPAIRPADPNFADPPLHIAP